MEETIKDYISKHPFVGIYSLMKTFNLSIEEGLFYLKLDWTYYTIGSYESLSVYNKKSNIIYSISDGSTWLRHTYDDNGNHTSQISSTGFIWERKFDENNFEKYYKDNDNNEITYSYDNGEVCQHHNTCGVKKLKDIVFNNG